MCYGRIGSSCSTNGNGVKELRTDIGVTTTNITYPRSSVRQIFHGGDDFKFNTRRPWLSSFPVSSNPLSKKAQEYQGAVMVVIV